MNKLRYGDKKDYFQRVIFFILDDSYRKKGCLLTYISIYELIFQRKWSVNLLFECGMMKKIVNEAETWRSLNFTYAGKKLYVS